MTLAATVASSFIVTGVSMFWLLPHLQSSTKMLDVPNFRSSHVRPTPRGGGIAVVLGLFVGVATGEAESGWTGAYSILVPLSIFAALGLLDDRSDLPVSVRLAVQFAVSFVTMGVLLMHGTINGVGIGIGLIVGTIWLVGFTNAFNFMDGINGISSIHGAVAGLWFFLLGQGFDVPVVAIIGAGLAGSSVGFLPWNAPQARVFLGDVGSYTMGSAIALLAVVAVLNGVPVLLVAAPTVVYLLDTSITLATRVHSGQSWRQAHRQHVYQRLVHSGSPHTTVAVFVGLITVVIAAGASVMQLMDRPVTGAAIIVAAALVYLTSPGLLTRAPHR